MFKLFKDLTRPPEPLAPRPVHSDASPISTPYAVRQARGGAPNATPGSAGTTATLPTPATVPNPLKVVEVDETDENAKTVVELLRKLETAGDMMHYVEVSLRGTLYAWLNV